MEKVSEPSLNVAFIDVMLPPPPPAGGGGRKPIVKTETQKPPVPDTKPVQPTEDQVPDKPPVPTTEAPIDDLTPSAPVDDSSGSGDGPGIGPGDGPGVGPGTGDNPDSGGDLPSDGDDDMPVRLSVGMTRPEAISKVTPKYTEAARKAGVQGTVIVEAVIDEQGRVTNVHVLRGLPMGLDRMAVEAIQQWRFRPAMRGDKPVKVYFTLTAIFSIQR